MELNWSALYIETEVSLVETCPLLTKGSYFFNLRFLGARVTVHGVALARQFEHVSPFLSHRIYQPV
jgi:hypothetical protein